MNTAKTWDPSNARKRKRHEEGGTVAMGPRLFESVLKNHGAIVTQPTKGKLIV